MINKRSAKQKFWEHIERIKKLFKNVNKEKLEKACRTGKLSEVAKVLGVSEKELKDLLENSRKLFESLTQSIPLRP